MKPYIDNQGFLNVLGCRICLSHTEEALVRTILDHGGFATLEQLGQAWGEAMEAAFDRRRDAHAVKAHLHNVRKRLPEGVTLVCHRGHGYKLDAPGFAVVVPRVEPRKLARCGHPSRLTRQCEECRARFYPCGHSRTQENSHVHSANGYLYPRCKACRREIDRRYRVRRAAEAKDGMRDVA